MTITIISGGQTGVDRAALDFAIEAKLLHGGWCPKGRLAADGVIPHGGWRDWAERFRFQIGKAASVPVWLAPIGVRPLSL